MNQPIKVCFVIDELWGRGGTECQLCHLINHLDRSRIEPFLVLPRGTVEDSGEMTPKNCPTLYFGLKSFFSFRAVAKAWEFHRFLKREKIDLVQAYFYDSMLFGCSIAKFSGIKAIFGAKRDIGHHLDPVKQWRGKMLNRFCIDRIVANAEACKRAVVEQENAKPENVVVIPNAIEAWLYDAVPTWTPKQSDPSNEFRIGAVGNFKHVKGTDILIRAAKIVLEKKPNVRFEIAGEGDFDLYNGQIRELGIEERFHLAGTVLDVPKFLSTLDVAVLPSRAEGLSNGLLEYMAAGRPIIATDVGGNGELIRHEKNGLLVPSENPQALADAICELLDQPEKSRLYAETARADVREKYNADRIADLFCDLCEKVLRKTSKNSNKEPGV